MQQRILQGFRLSPQQKRVWLQQQQSWPSTYESHVTVRIDGSLDIALFKRAFDHVVRRHEILRSTYQLLPGMTIPIQHIEDDPAVELEISQSAIAPNTEGTGELSREEVKFELTSLPLLRAELSQRSHNQHTLTLRAPALSADGPSLQHLVQQIAAAYGAYRLGEEVHDQPVMQYADFAEWQNELLESEGGAGRQHWSQQDLVRLPTRRLPLEGKDPNGQFEPKSVAVEISPETGFAIRAFAAEEEVPIETLLLACWQICIWRSTEWKDVTVWVTLDARKFDELEGAIGALVNDVPVTSHPHKYFTFRELLRDLKLQRNQADSYQEYFTREGEDQLIPIGFEMRSGFENYAYGGLTFTCERQESCAGPFKLKLVAEQRSGGIQIELKYDASRFTVADVRLIGKRLETLISSAISNPNLSLADLTVLSDEERQRLLIDFNDTHRDFPVNKCVHQLFEAQVDKTPSQVAVIFENEQLTFNELNQRANQLAHYLRSLGVGPDSPVALCLERSANLIVGLLGILKAGGAYLPLDPGLPPARIATMLNTAGTHVVITQATLAGIFTGRSEQVVLLDSDRELLAKESTVNPQLAVSDENLVYIIFTSGSSGTPKGVAVEHKQLANYLHAIGELLELPASSSFASVSTIAADLGNSMVFPPLCSGGTLHLISEERASNPAALADYFSWHPIDCLKIVPSHLNALLTGSDPAGVLPRKLLVLGGEACPRSLIATLKSLAPDCRILNHYGPTEATVGCAALRIRDKALENADSVPVGYPLGNTQLLILDRVGSPVPIGAPGELYIGGNGIARGYINGSAATAEKFIPNPVGTHGDRLYRTGDLVRHLSDGRIEFLGRIDNQVKIRGYRIEPDEISVALCEHPTIAASTVIAREDQRGEKQLLAYVVAHVNHQTDVGELRAYLRRKLPEYMLPSALIVLERLPLTPNGKIDRAALPSPERARDQVIAPRTQIEETLVRIWSNVLGIENVGIHNNFFELGGDSILSIQVIARANQAGLRFSPRQLFQHQTIAELAEVVGSAAVVEAEQGPVTGLVPLTPIQKRFFQQNQPDPHYYNQSRLLRVDEAVTPDVIRRALERLQQHHDALSLRFVRTGNDWQQSIESHTGEVTFSVIDLTGLSDEAKDLSIHQHMQRLHESLDLAEGRLLRAAFFDCGVERSNYLFLVIHHLAVDGVSWAILLDDLQTASMQLISGESIQLPPKTTSFKSWAERIRHYANQNNLEAEIPYWLSLRAKDEATLPIDFEGGNNTAASASTVVVSLNADDTRAVLQDLPSAFRTQINEVLLTALARTMKSWTGAASLLMDLEGHGREEIVQGIDLSRTVGWFTSVFPILLDVPASATATEALRLVKEQLRAVPQRGVGYGLLRYLSPRTEIAEQLQALPQAQLRFNYLGQLDRGLSESGLFKPVDGSRVPAQSPRNERGYLLNIIGSVTGNELRLEWIYSDRIHRRETIERLAEQYMMELQSLISESRHADSASYVPSDFPQAKVNQEELNKVLAKLGKQEKAISKDDANAG